MVQPCSTGQSDSRPDVWSVDHPEKVGLPYFTRTRSPGLTVNIQNPLLAPGETGIQTASYSLSHPSNSPFPGKASSNWPAAEASSAESVYTP